MDFSFFLAGSSEEAESTVSFSGSLVFLLSWLTVCKLVSSSPSSHLSIGSSEVQLTVCANLSRNGAVSWELKHHSLMRDSVDELSELTPSELTVFNLLIQLFWLSVVSPSPHLMVSRRFLLERDCAALSTFPLSFRLSSLSKRTGLFSCSVIWPAFLKRPWPKLSEPVLSPTSVGTPVLFDSNAVPFSKSAHNISNKVKSDGLVFFLESCFPLLFLSLFRCKWLEPWRAWFDPPRRCNDSDGIWIFRLEGFCELLEVVASWKAVSVFKFSDEQSVKVNYQYNEIIYVH